MSEEKQAEFSRWMTAANHTRTGTEYDWEDMQEAFLAGAETAEQRAAEAAHEPEPAKVIVVRDENGREHRYAAPNFGMMHDGTLLIGDKAGGEDLRVDAARAPGRWSAVHKDNVLAPDSAATALGIARRALEEIAKTVLEADDPRREVVRVARDAVEEIFAETEL